MKTNNRIKSRMKKLRGTIRCKGKNGNLYYRLTIASGLRKEFPLKTKDEAEAVKKAEELDSIWAAPTLEVAAAQINAIKGFNKVQLNLDFEEAYQKYLEHPERARPHTIAEQNSYQATYKEFVAFTIANSSRSICGIADITSKDAQAFAEHLRTLQLAVDTHNRKIKHLRRIFRCLHEYYEGDNPFESAVLFRKAREEQATVMRRQAFTKEQEQKLRNVLADDKYKVMNKPEIRVIYYLGMFTGQRLKDCVLLQWQNVDMEHKKIWVKQFKTGKDVVIPIAKELFEVLTEAQGWKGNQYVCPKTAARYSKCDQEGKNTGNNLVNKDVLRAIGWIGLEASVEVPGRKKKMTVYGFHSLRHSFASFCAEAGVPKAVLLSILGTDSDIADKYYTHVGEEAQQQAIAAISDVNKQATLNDRIQQVIVFLNSNPQPTQEVFAKIKKMLGE